MEPGAPSTADLDDEVRENGGVRPTHGRTMQEQKEWFRQRAAAHRAAAMAAARTEAAIESDELASRDPSSLVRDGVAAATSDGRDKVAAATPGVAELQASPDAKDGQSDPFSDGLSDGLRELALAGGDLRALGALATGESRPELTLALKALGFRGLKTRQELEQQLREWQAVQ